EAAVTGFSGASPPANIAPGEDPGEKTFIDLSGPSLRVVDLRHMGGPAAAQLVGAPKRFTFAARDVGQVFGVALDDGAPPNIYVAATSAYGLPIVAPGAGGASVHVRTGVAGARFMPGLWGPRGGPGSIYRIDGVTGKVTLFANVTSDGRANSGAALGALAFDPHSKSLYVSDRESGLIHRFSLAGAELGVYDHGAAGLAAQGLPPVAWTSTAPLDLTNPKFDSSDPGAWNYAQPARRIFGLAVRDRRLYYAVADSLRIWSVGLKDDGAFGDDAIIEFAAPPAAGPTEISTIAFDGVGRMLLAERAAPTGAFGFEPIAAPSIGRLLRYAIVGQAPRGRRVWQEIPDEYAIGFPGDYRNVDGGVAEGYNYAHSGELLAGSCGGFLWTTGEDLRDAADPALAERLSKTGPLHVDGLRGEGGWWERPRNVPPLTSYFVAYGDGPWDEAYHGRLGAIAIRRDCAPGRYGLLGARWPGGARPAPMGPPRAPPTGGPPTPTPTPPPPPPPGGCNPNEIRVIRDGGATCQPSCPPPGVQIGNTCCSPSGLAPNAACSNSSCPAGQTPIGPSNFCCDNGHVYSSPSGGPACCPSALVNGQCAQTPPSPICAPTNPNCAPTCAAGYVAVGGACCLAGQVTSTGVCCPLGEEPSGPNKSVCRLWTPVPPRPSCCGPGLIPTVDGPCCAPGNVTSNGVCCAKPVDPTNRAVCPAPETKVPAPGPVLPAPPPPSPACAQGYAKVADGSCCLIRNLSADGRLCLTAPQACPPGETRNAAGACVPIVAPACPRGMERVGATCAPLCPPGEARTAAGRCAPVSAPACPPGEIRRRHGTCVPIAPTRCPEGRVRNRAGVCAPAAPPPCPPGLVRNARGVCAPRLAPCPPGLVRSRFGACVPFGGPGLFAPPRAPVFPTPGGGLKRPD
ncbi:MAG TPA: hypothetical protein VEF36_03880, partial [Roseiarcus sp.]|nr:hypothetical protein [Roseiarcus sp.]